MNFGLIVKAGTPIVTKIVTISLHPMTAKYIDRAGKCLKGPAKSDRTEGFGYH